VQASATEQNKSCVVDDLVQVFAPLPFPLAFIDSSQNVGCSIEKCNSLIIKKNLIYFNNLFESGCYLIGWTNLHIVNIFVFLFSLQFILHSPAATLYVHKRSKGLTIKDGGLLPRQSLPKSDKSQRNERLPLSDCPRDASVESLPVWDTSCLAELIYQIKSNQIFYFWKQS